jgi:hypothetical protein
MDPTRFDRLARALAGRRSRRAALAAGGAGLAARALGRPAAAQEASPAAGAGAGGGGGGEEELLFVQTFASGTWAAKAGEAGAYELVLAGAAGPTVYFANRPDREAGALPTEQLPGFLGFDPADPPNAAVVVPVAEGEEAVLVVELLDPRLDAAAGTLAYDARPLAAGGYEGGALAGHAARQAGAGLPAAFGPGALFIDAKNKQRGRGSGARASCRQQKVYCMTYEAGFHHDLGVLGTYDMCQSGGCCRPCHASDDQLDNDCRRKFSNHQGVYADWGCF